ncbi:hypothetical protein PGT21_018422 [Puccinia graminis f. sp. tritici]|uniref:FAD-binding FR-type domain-containing protein n=1 Tax=Puccinia graminis f. sp. tritici TaxID=56615 RepID=A0A5B0NQR2_PUCGR|nr:hypothetical protein PGT21_018422 [Puccinia graminis f. sp. tritici]KAA1125508.1 hypothetical protein PGTUg99_011040 [Puccinia graminis f. sp. tritici]
MGAPARPVALLDWQKPEWLYLAAIFGFIFLLIIRRIALYLIDHSLRGNHKSGTKSDLRLHPTRWHNIVFGYEAFQTKYLNRPAICRIAGTNIFGCLDWAEVMMILLLYLINILLIVVPIKYSTMATLTGALREKVALRATRCIVIQLPILFATAGRCSLLSSLVGASYRSMNFIHRAIGRLCFLLVIVHVLCTISTLSMMLGPATAAKIRTSPSLRCATGAVCCVFISATLSFQWVRHRQFNLFLITHVLAAAVLLPLIYHHRPVVAPWLTASAVIWAIDRFNRWTGIILNHVLASLFVRSNGIGTITATVDRLEGAIVLRIPMHFTWSPGQHIYISFWSSKMLTKPWLYGRWHPFTLTNLSSDGTLRRKDGTEVDQNDRRSWTGCCLVQVRGGTTKWLEEHAGANIQVLIDGPYGGNGGSIAAYSTLVLIAGGAGITYVLGVLEGVAISARRNQGGQLRRVEVHWVLRKQSQLAWVEDRISEIRGILEGFDLEIITHAYITRGVRVSPGVRSDMVSRPIPIAVKLGRMGNHEYLKMLRQAPAPPSPPMKSDSTVIDKERVSAFNQVSGRPNLDHLIATACEQSLGRVLIHVCGPRSLSDAVKLSAARQSSPLEAWKGNLGRCIVLHHDLFNTT